MSETHEGKEQEAVPPTEGAVASPKPTLTIHFQGLCCFVRDAPKYEDSTKVCVLLLDSRRLAGPPALCRHYPALSVVDEDISALPERFRGRTAVIPGKRGNSSAANAANRALQMVDLRRTDLTIDGLVPKKMDFSTSGDDACTHILDLVEMAGSGRISTRFCTDAVPRKLIAARFILPAGRLRVIAKTKKEEWLLSKQGPTVPMGVERGFAQEVLYEYLGDFAGDRIDIRLRRFRSIARQTLRLIEGAHIGVSNLCQATDAFVDAQSGIKIDDDKDDGWDALIYHELLEGPAPVPERLIPRRKTDQFGNPQTRAGADACPPGSAVAQF